MSTIAVNAMHDESLSHFSKYPSIQKFAQNIADNIYKGEILLHYSSDMKIRVDNSDNKCVAIYFVNEVRNPSQKCSYEMSIATFCAICGVTKKEVKEKKCTLKN